MNQRIMLEQVLRFSDWHKIFSHNKHQTIMSNQIKFPTDEQLPPEGCGIIIEFFDVPNPEPGPDSGNAADFVDARIKSVTFVRDVGEWHQQQMIEIRFNENGEIEIRETHGGFIDVMIPDRARGDLFHLVQSFKIT